jgi:phage terminase Nu1 subunit (DNA packaging protein)
MAIENKPTLQRFVSQAEYARHRGISRQHVSRLVKAGVLITRGGRVDVVASDAVLDDRPQPIIERAAPEPGETATAGAYAQAKTAEMVYRAKLRKLDFEVRSGKLIPADEVKVQWFKVCRGIRDKLLAIPQKLAPQLAGLSDLHEVRDVLASEIEAALKGLNDELRYRSAG